MLCNCSWCWLSPFLVVTTLSSCRINASVAAVPDSFTEASNRAARADTSICEDDEEEDESSAWPTGRVADGDDENKDEENEDADDNEAEPG